MKETSHAQGTETAFEGADLSVPQVVTREAAPYIAIPVSGPMADMPEFALPLFPKLHEWMATRRLEGEAGFFRYCGFLPDGGVDMEVATFLNAQVKGDGYVMAGEIPAGRYVSATYTGPYDRLYDAMCMLSGWLRGRGLVADEECRDGGRFPAVQMEIYRITPGDSDQPTDWKTDILLKLKD